VVPIVLVVVALLGSVAIPARQTWRITQLLHETTEVLAPARLLQAQLQSGLAKERAALQDYVLVGDGALLEQYRTAATEDARRLAALEQLTARLGIASANHVRTLRQRIDTWRGIIGITTGEAPSPSDVATALRAGQAPYELAVSAAMEVSPDLAGIAAARDDRVRALEHLSLVSNAALVLTALVAMIGVATLTVRERRLTTTLRRRIDEARRHARREVALREAAEALAGAYTGDEVARRIAAAALEAMEGSGAFVEQLVARAGEAPHATVVRAVAGTGVPALDRTCPFAGSHTQLVTASGRPMLIPNLTHLEERGVAGTRANDRGTAIALALGTEDTPVGALFVIRTTPDAFQPDDLTRAGIFGHLATLAYEKVRLLEDANERRRVLERVIQSRSRLMRGFSHDVKNPIGAADGFADLLSLGVYGELSDEQRASVERIRGCLRGALALIDDLHELARAETGILALSSDRVNLADLARAICEEYHGAARAAGLSLSVEVDLDLPIIDTDRERVRQIAANLLSNTIKYTKSGSVLVRASHRPAGATGETGNWALVEVIDTGPGIPLEKHDIIFEEFSRLESGERRGAGLGLAISKLLAHALGGHIAVQSAPGHGSAFTLWLPLGNRALK
jgi:signal transduction histidine kinase